MESSEKEQRHAPSPGRCVPAAVELLPITIGSPTCGQQLGAEVSPAA